MASALGDWCKCSTPSHLGVKTSFKTFPFKMQLQLCLKFSFRFETFYVLLTDYYWVWRSFINRVHFIYTECYTFNCEKLTCFWPTLLEINLLFIELSRGEICVANLKALLPMVWVWVINKSEKNLKFYLNGGHFHDNMGHL